MSFCVCVCVFFHLKIKTTENFYKSLSVSEQILKTENINAIMWMWGSDNTIL